MILGTSNGLTPAGSQFLLLATPGKQLGMSVASGDFNNDGFDDVVAGAPLDTVGTQAAAGEIGILMGSAGGLSLFQFYQEGNFSGHHAEANDNFGAAVASRDFNNDGFADIAIGIPGEDTGATASHGEVILAWGSATGIVTSGSQTLSPSSVGATPASNDQFGKALGLGDFDGAGGIDLVIGMPDDDIGAAVDAGSVFVAYSLVGPSPQTWNQNSTGIADTAETGDGFGGGLDANGSKSAPEGLGGQDIAHLITADVEFDSVLTKTNKRRFLSSRR